MQFRQPDTLIPGAGDIQAWDRYAYAKNSPVRYTDPSGHWADEGCGRGKKCNVSDFWQRPVRDPKATQPTSTSVPVAPKQSVLTKTECLGGSWACPYWREFEEFNQAVQYIDSVSDVADLIVNFGRPAYRHLKGPASIGGPVFEGIIGGILQFAKDAQNPSLNIGQMLARAGLVAAEDAITDVISEGFGYRAASFSLPVVGGAIVFGTDGAGAPVAPVGAVGGALVTKVVASTLANEAMNEYIWRPANSYLFPEWRLGSYP